MIQKIPEIQIEYRPRYTDVYLQPNQTPPQDVNFYCPYCSCGIRITDLGIANAVCPSCGIGFYIYWPDGDLMFTPPPSLRKKIRKRNKGPRKYIESKEILLAMPYTEYLQSEHWKQKREAALIAAEYRCQLCYSDKNLEVHHRTYERRGCERPSDLTVLCHTCHCQFHGFKENE